MSLYEQSLKLLLQDEAENVRIGEKPILADLMELCHYNNRACLHIIVGPRGAGKSTYALMAANAFETNDYTSKCFIDMSDVIFTVEDFVAKVKNIYSNIIATCYGYKDEAKCIAEKRKPYIIIDDAGVQFSKYVPRFSPRVAHAVKGVLDLIRMVVSNIIFTSPMHTGLLKVIREDVDAYTAVIDYLDSKYSIVKIYSIPRIVPWGVDWRFYRKKLGVEAFERHTCCYDKYMSVKKEMTKHAINQLRDALKEKKRTRAKYIEDIYDDEHMSYTYDVMRDE